jgi:hypothetical protein
LPNRHLIDVNTEQKRDNAMKEWAYWVEEHQKPKKEQLEINPLNTWFINNFEKFKLISAALSLVGFFLRMHLLQLVIHVSTSLVIPYHTKRSWFINNFEKFKLIDGILYRVINTNGELVRQLVLPETCIATVMTSLHDGNSYGIPCEMVGYDKDVLISAFGSLK